MSHYKPFKLRIFNQIWFNLSREIVDLDTNILSYILLKYQTIINSIFKYLFKSTRAFNFSIYRQALKYFPANWGQLSYFLTHVILHIVLVHDGVDFKENTIILAKLPNTAHIRKMILSFGMSIKNICQLFFTKLKHIRFYKI